MSLESLQNAIRDAAASRAPLRLRGGGSKDFYGNEARGTVLDTRAYAGIVSYEPTELVVTARCGTRLSELESVLEREGQCLPFEPPHFGAEATLGGCVAAGLSGPRRASAGAVRDFVLGTKIVDGRGRVMSFGGQVMKNVAGYDIARMLAGTLGTLALIAEVSPKVLPRPADELSLKLEMPLERALETMNRWAGRPLPITASAWHDGELAVRLSGSEVALRSAREAIGGTALDAPEAQAYWRAIREHTHPFFAGSEPLWRIAVPSAAGRLRVEGKTLIEWGGGLRWLRSAAGAGAVREVARELEGHATLFRAADKSAGAFMPLPAQLARLHRELKDVFDPAGILNPGRMYREL
ncbi:MAG: glycolate oxidase subunit GlcE [Betaproteobacteria bacterium RIFCSPLOWO2_12_FULL_65_14]|nr:MAG: glycolate oxidase subunit GlcE [Betaproteobacteria bacterium RIFCSPLOWO2_12_FULL_65_14]